MKRTSFRRAIAPGAAILALTLSVTACGAGNEEGTTDAGESSLSGELNGSGASSQEKAQAAWRAGFQADNPDVTINYDPAGSGTGRENFISGAVAFAGSDAYLDDEEGELTDAKERCLGEDPIEIPAYVSPIAIVFNLKGVDELNLSAETVAGIFDGKITKWNDPKIVADNPDAKLPGTEIVPVHRSDDSGTTENLTDYLNKAGNGAWKYDADGVWPIKGGEAAEGTSGLVAAVNGGEGTIGYADASQASGLGVASIKVGEEFVAPSAEAAAKIIPVSPKVEGRSDVDMAIDVDRTTTEAGTYPVVLVSYLLACQHYESAEEADLVKGFLTYIVSSDGQEVAAAPDAAGSAPLDAATAEKATAVVEAITTK